MQTIFDPYERFLRLDRISSTTDLLRARAVYILGWAFIMTQCVNIILMTVSFGSWTYDHTVALMASIIVAIIINCLRFTNNFILFAGLFSGLLFVSISASALQESTGINSALLPMFVVGSLFNGFIGGWRMVVAFLVMSLVLIVGLHGVSARVAPTDAAAAAIYEARIFQRGAQASLAIIWTSVFSIFITLCINHIFERLEQAYTDIKKSELDKLEFLANLSHELRTPLNGVTGMTRLLSGTTQDATQKKYTNILDKCGKRLSHIVVDALMLSKMDSGDFELETASFNLKSQLEELADLYRTAATAKGLALEVDFAPQLPEYYMGDAKQLRQVFKNLIVNALKFTQSGSVNISVSGRLKGADSVHLKISVADTGIGIVPDNIDRIFKRFHQVEKGLERKHSGTGLGLAICRELVTQMGGEISVESRLNEGSRFDIELTMPVGWPPEAEQDKLMAAETLDTIVHAA